MSNPSDLFADRFAQLGIKLNPDGSITRLGPIILTPPTTIDPTLNNPTFTPQEQLVVHKDIPINQSKNTLMRIILHRNTLDHPANKLPLILYFHGGGFIIGGATEPLFHNFCSTLVVDIPSIVISVGYRLAPEHRLPAAYEDCVEALHYIKTLDDEWLTNYADFSNTYLMGSSAGGNIAYHTGLRLGAVDDLGSINIKGLILHQPFFGGTERTKSELRLINDQSLPLDMGDFMWEKGLPVGADRDHEFCNPNGSGEIIREVGWKVLVTGCEGDPLIDRQVELVKMLEGKKVKVVGKFDEGGCHGVEVFDPLRAKALVEAIKHFMQS